jgi:hypothetical protein
MLKRKGGKHADGRRTKVESLSSLVRKLDSEFSRYVRLKAADGCGTVQCVTCGKLMHWKESHASHFISRRHMALRWSEDPPNVHVCCPRCNVFEAGALEEYSRFILDTYGRETFDRLLNMKRETKKWLRSELCELRDKYKAAAREQEARVSVCEQ